VGPSEQVADLRLHAAHYVVLTARALLAATLGLFGFVILVSSTIVKSLGCPS